MEVIKTVKKLKQQKHNVESELEMLKSEVTSKKLQLNQLKQQITKLEKNTKVSVSDHAIVRYLERVTGLDMEKIKSHILNDGVLNKLKEVGGNASIPHEQGFNVKFKDYTATTCT